MEHIWIDDMSMDNDIKGSTLPNDSGDDSDDSSDNSDTNDSCIAVPDLSIPKRKRKKPYKLLSYCETRWYSAVLVMRRFYSLYESMKSLYDDMEQNPTAYSKQKKNEFMASMGKIDKRELLRAVCYLQPLVQGIAICQADTTLQMNVIPLLRSIRDYYLSHAQEGDELFFLNQKDMGLLFIDDKGLFKRTPKHLYSLFYDNLNLKVDMKTTLDPETQKFIYLVKKDIRKLLTAKNPLVSINEINRLCNIADKDILTYLGDTDSRIGISVNQYFIFNSWKYQMLATIYRDQICQVASSAAVERSFSVQSLILQPRRSCLSTDTLRCLLRVKQNSTCCEKSGRLALLRHYLSEYDYLKEKGTTLIPKYN